MTNRPKCFIAMAFGHDDTDALYKKGILPVLRSEKITPIIINRREFNGDITSEILSLVRGADFCITDLTYARPSVYYEAGFAERESTVIYTVRKDHFENTYDSSRVHFDLSVRSIIGWAADDYIQFQPALRKRIRKTFLRGWETRQRKNARLIEESSDFLMASIDIQKYVMVRETLKGLRSLGISNWFARDRRGRLIKRKNPLRSNADLFDPEYVYVENHRLYPHIGTVYAAKNLTSTAFDSIVRRSEVTLGDSVLYRSIRGVDKKIEFHHVVIICTVKKVNVDALRRRWSHAELAAPSVILFPSEFRKSWEDQTDYASSTQIYVFISPVKHPSDIAGKLNENVRFVSFGK